MQYFLHLQKKPEIEKKRFVLSLIEDSDYVFGISLTTDVAVFSISLIYSVKIAEVFPFAFRD